MASQTRINGPVSADPAVSKTPESTTTRRTAAKRTVKSDAARKMAPARQAATDTAEKYTAAAPWPTLPPEPEAAAPGPAELNAQDEASGDTEEAPPETAEAKAETGQVDVDQADAEKPSEAAGTETADDPDSAAAADETAVESPPAENQRPVPDEELISLLERLSVTIDNAHQVLDEAAGINTQPQQARAAQQEQQEHMDAGQDDDEPEEQRAVEPEESRAAEPARDVPAADMPVADVPVARVDDDPYALLDREIPAARPVWLNERPPEKRRATSIALLVTLMLMAPVAGAGWFVYANPGLIAGTIASDMALASTGGDARRETAVTKQASASMVASEAPAGSVPDAEGKTQAQSPAEAAGKLSPGAARAGSADIPGNATVESAPLPPDESLTPPDPEPAAVEVASLGPDTPQAGESGGDSDPNVIRGAAGQPIEVPLVLPPATAHHEVSIMVEGVPDGARLSVGKSIGRGTWILNGSEADSLALETDPGFEPERFPLGITMVKSDGKAPQVRSIDIVIEGTGAAEPANDTASAEKAAQEWSPSGVPISKEQERTLLERGETLLESGDVAAARLVFSYAAQRGSAPAMQALARSYDPKHLLKIGVYGVEPDRAEAAVWYERALRYSEK